MSSWASRVYAASRTASSDSSAAPKAPPPEVIPETETVQYRLVVKGEPDKSNLLTALLAQPMVVEKDGKPATLDAVFAKESQA